uniref:Fungal lipase-type domain-containing protein n=1 Tax=viral metagenome TaxID=1070528 RepID=A0A6C0IVH8_9ZZZZ
MNINLELVKDMCKLSSVCYNNTEKLKNLYNSRPCQKQDQVIYKCKNIPIIKSTKNDCQYFSTLYNNCLIICFRGTESKKDILIDLNIMRTGFKIGDEKNILVHEGFNDQFIQILPSITEDITNYISNKRIVNKKIIFTGHSLGGALATLGSCFFSYKYPQISVNCITFGSPRVGCSNFAYLFDKHCDTSLRYINRNDPVTSFPTAWRYKHVKGCQWIHDHKIKDEILPWRFWRFCKNYILSFIGFGYDASEDHSCSEYLKKLNI